MLPIVSFARVAWQLITTHRLRSVGKDVVLSGDVNADSFFVVMPQGGQMTTMTLRVPYPLGFAARAASGRIDDPAGGWKGRGFWSSYSMYTPWQVVALVEDRAKVEIEATAVVPTKRN
jgi:hypothetical protein